MGLITDLNPLNLQQEKEKFFQDKSYNPQFIYSRGFSQEELTKYGLPQEKYFEYAKKMIAKYGAYQVNRYNQLEASFVHEKCLDLFDRLYIQALPIYFSFDFLSKVMISNTALYFRLPIFMTEKSLAMKLNHEIQTHYLRKLNQQQVESQGININKTDPNIARVEEGLAGLHSYIFSDYPVIRKSFVGYYATYLAHVSSFSDTFKALTDLGMEEEAAFMITARKKRGLTDTSQKGGFTKDIIYLEGAVMVWNYLINEHHDPHDLYLGRMSLEQIQQHKKQINTSQHVYPDFFENLDIYLDEIRRIGEKSEYTSLL